LFCGTFQRAFTREDELVAILDNAQRDLRSVCDHPEASLTTVTLVSQPSPSQIAKVHGYTTKLQGQFECSRCLDRLRTCSRRGFRCAAELRHVLPALHSESKECQALLDRFRSDSTLFQRQVAASAKELQRLREAVEAAISEPVVNTRRRNQPQGPLVFDDSAETLLKALQEAKLHAVPIGDPEDVVAAEDKVALLREALVEVRLCVRPLC
jgi:hypothetical protein